MEHEPAIVEHASARLVSPDPAAEWEVVQQSLGALGESLARRRDCGEVEGILDTVRSARGALDRLEHGLESAHLSCCILPDVVAPEELSKALARLSSNRVGGLVAVERQQRLDEYIARGTPLDAELSANLLESLFHPGGALHDGAVIVRDGRIMAAGVFLPVMAERRDPIHGRLLGGRHRAALALSRLTDALVFVVSEESGDVSLAVRGQLHPGLHVGAMAPSGAPAPEPVAIRPSAFVRLRLALRSWSSQRRGPMS